MADIKKAATERWVSAVNEDGSFGKWAYEMVRQVGEFNAVVTKATKGRVEEI